MDDNVMHIFGFVIKPIHVSVFYNSIFLLMGAGGIYAWFKTRWQSRGNRHMHRYVPSVNEVSDVDREGYRTLKLRNLGMVEHVDTVIHGDKVRKWLIAAACRCNWVHRFIKDSNPKHQGAILEAARNVLVPHFADGVLAHLLDLSTFEKKVIFSLTGSDTEIGGVRMIRNVIASEGEYPGLDKLFRICHLLGELISPETEAGACCSNSYGRQRKRRLPQYSGRPSWRWCIASVGLRTKKSRGYL